MEAVSVKTEPPWDGAAAHPPPPATHAVEGVTSLAAPVTVGAEAAHTWPEAVQVKREGAPVKREVNDSQDIVDMMQEVINPQVHADDAMVVKKEPDEHTSKLNPHNVVIMEDFRVELAIEFEVPGERAGGSGTAHTSESETQQAIPEPQGFAPLVTFPETKTPAERHRHRRATSAPPVSCDTCAKSFKCSIALEQHMRSHTGEEPFACDRCDWRFAQLKDLKRHYGTHLRAKWKTFLKKLIQLGVVTDEGIKGARAYSCGTCDVRVSEQRELNTHEQTHSHDEEKPYPCTMCDERFSELNGLTEHERQHTGEKPYSCPACHKKFANLTHFRNHSRVHTGDKPYTCNTCHKHFSQQSTLTRHQLTHTHTCPLCGRGYSRASDLKRHERTHTSSPSL